MLPDLIKRYSVILGNEIKKVTSVHIVCVAKLQGSLFRSSSPTAVVSYCACDNSDISAYILLTKEDKVLPSYYYDSEKTKPPSFTLLSQNPH